MLRGDRAIYEGIAAIRRGRFCDVDFIRGDHASVTFTSDGARILVPAASLHVVPRRPDPDF